MISVHPGLYSGAIDTVGSACSTLWSTCQDFWGLSVWLALYCLLLWLAFDLCCHPGAPFTLEGLSVPMQSTSFIFCMNCQTLGSNAILCRRPVWKRDASRVALLLGGGGGREWRRPSSLHPPRDLKTQSFTREFYSSCSRVSNPPPLLSVTPQPHLGASMRAPLFFLTTIISYLIIYINLYLILYASLRVLENLGRFG